MHVNETAFSTRANRQMLYVKSKQLITKPNHVAALSWNILQNSPSFHHTVVVGLERLQSSMNSFSRSLTFTKADP